MVFLIFAGTFLQYRSSGFLGIGLGEPSEAPYWWLEEAALVALPACLTC